ncbi:MAG: hypothetical protein ACP5PM_00820 [Acidimicrobiales bacterium]
MARGPSNSSGSRWLGRWRARRSRDSRQSSGPPARDDPFPAARRTRAGGIKLARRHERALSREVVEDCGAFLLGRYAEELESRSLAVPVWAWTNVLAHGTPTDLRRTADDSRVGPGSTREWRAARAYVAAELLEATARDQSLAETQRQHLVPLELQLATRSDVERWTPQRWVAAVRSSIATREARDVGKNGNTRRG